MKCFHRQRIEHLVDELLLEKEKLDAKHVIASARHGCSCRRCRAARKSLRMTPGWRKVSR